MLSILRRLVVAHVEAAELRSPLFEKQSTAHAVLDRFRLLEDSLSMNDRSRRARSGLKSQSILLTFLSRDCARRSITLYPSRVRTASSPSSR